MPSLIKDIEPDAERAWGLNPVADAILLSAISVLLIMAVNGWYKIIMFSMYFILK